MLDKGQSPTNFSDFSHNLFFLPQPELHTEHSSMQNFHKSDSEMLASIMFNHPLSKPQSFDLFSIHEDQTRSEKSGCQTSPSDSCFEASPHQMHVFPPLEPPTYPSYAPTLIQEDYGLAVDLSPGFHSENSSPSSQCGETTSEWTPSSPDQPLQPIPFEIFPDASFKTFYSKINDPFNQVRKNTIEGNWRAISQSTEALNFNKFDHLCNISDISAAQTLQTAAFFPADSGRTLQESQSIIFQAWGSHDTNSGNPLSGPSMLEKQLPSSWQSQYIAAGTSNTTDAPIKNVSRENLKRYPCPECGQRFARAFNLQTHIATHAGTRPFSCPADGCSKAFSRRHDLARHIGAVHRDWLVLNKLSPSEASKPLRSKSASRRQN